MSRAPCYGLDTELLLRPREVGLPERLAKECWRANSG
jgi:hypothetical protein